ncbi:MAG: SGNH/GDSL hydrolase family protein [Bdellovibrionota bacterium]
MKFPVFLLFAFASQFAYADEAILFIGDSHSVMSFGKSLAQSLGPSVKRYAVSSTTAADWLKRSICSSGKPCEFTYGYSTPAGDFAGPVPSDLGGINSLLASTSAKKVIIALGTNDANQRCRLTPSAGMKPIKALLKRLGSRDCLWVGPPAYKRGPVFDSCGEAYDLFVSRMESVIRAHGCRFIDSRRILDLQTQQPIEADLDDQLHFSYEKGQAWGEAVADEIIRSSSASRPAN